MNKKFFLVDLKQSIGDEAPWENYVSQTDYEKFETYVNSSGLSLFQVTAVGELHFNLYRNGDVERCNRLVLLKSLGGDQSIKYYTYLCDHDALRPPKVGDIIDAKLRLIEIDCLDLGSGYYWADSITPVDGNATFNMVDKYDY